MNRKEQLANQMRCLIRDSREAISDESALEAGNNTERYNKLKKEFLTTKDNINAPRRIDMEDLIYDIDNMVEEMDYLSWDDESVECKLLYINKIMRKLRVLKILTR